MKSDAVESRLMNLWIALLLIASVGAVIYSNIYRVPFVFDGIRQIEDKPKIRNLENYFSFKEVFYSPRPVVEFTFALNYKFGKLNVFGYHIVNVLIHVINGFLVYFLALTIFRQLYPPNVREDDSLASEGLQIQAERSKLKGKRGKAPDGSSQFSIFNFQFSIPMMSLVAALIFVAHPIQTQAVTYTVQRCASMAAMFYLAAVLFYLKARIIQQGAVDGGQRTEVSGRRVEGSDQKTVIRSQGPEGRGAFDFRLSAFFGLSIVCGMLAFLSKQNTASLPGAILLAEYLLFDRTWEGWKRRIPWFALMFALWTLFVFYVAGFFTGGIDGRGLLEDVSDFMREAENVSRWSYLCTQFNVLAIYIRLLFLPLGQNLYYRYPFKDSFFEDYTPLTFVFLMVIIFIGIWNLRKRPVITFGIFWFFITLSVESSFIPISDALFEHRLYLPVFGFALTISYLVFSFLSKKFWWAIAVSAAIVLCFGTATYLRNIVWQDKITLWSDVVSKSPQNYPAHYNLGMAFMEKGRMDEAIGGYSKALRINRFFPQAHNNLGNALAIQGKHSEAIKCYLNVLRFAPNDVDAHVNLGNVLALQGDFNRAVVHYTKALQINPGSAKAHLNLGNALMDQSKDKEATNHYLNALRIRPDFAEAHCKLGNVLMKQGDQKRAVEHFLEALRLKPDYTEVYNNLGIALAYQGRLDQAIIIFRKALSIHPNDIWARRNLNQALKEKTRLGTVNPN